MFTRHPYTQTVNSVTLDCLQVGKGIIIRGGVCISALEHCKKMKFRT